MPCSGCLSWHDLGTHNHHQLALMVSIDLRLLSYKASPMCNSSVFKEKLLLRVQFEVLTLVSQLTIPHRQKVVHMPPLFRNVFHEMSAWRGLANAFS